MVVRMGLFGLQSASTTCSCSCVEMFACTTHGLGMIMSHDHHLSSFAVWKQIAVTAHFILSCSNQLYICPQCVSYCFVCGCRPCRCCKQHASMTHASSKYFPRPFMHLFHKRAQCCVGTTTRQCKAQAAALSGLRTCYSVGWHMLNVLGTVVPQWSLK